MDGQVDGLCNPDSTLPNLTDNELLQHGTIILVAHHCSAHELSLTFFNGQCQEI